MCIFIGHLIKHFGITDTEWHRIRMNIDSKCRTAFRRKQRGLPLTVKAFGYKTGTPDADQPLDDSVSSKQEDAEIHEKVYFGVVLKF